MTRLSSNLPSHVPMQRYQHGGNNRALTYGEFHLFVGNNRDAVNAAADAWQNSSGSRHQSSLSGDSLKINEVMYSHYSLELNDTHAQAVSAAEAQGTTATLLTRIKEETINYYKTLAGLGNKITIV
jgi:hypothetical protein